MGIGSESEKAEAALAARSIHIWRAFDHVAEELESFATEVRDEPAALRFIKMLMKRHGCEKAITTDALRSYKAAMRAIGIADR